MERGRDRVRVPDDGIAVGLLLLDVTVSNRAAAAGPIDDRNWNIQAPGHAVGEISRRHVGRTAGTEHDGHLDGLAGGIGRWLWLCLCWLLLAKPGRHRAHAE